MQNSNEPPFSQSWMPAVAGVLTIIAGALSIIGGLVIGTIGEVIGRLLGAYGFWFVGLPLLLMGLLAVIGGGFALGRRLWGLALAGAMAALIIPLFGIAAIILVVLGKEEFR